MASMIYQMILGLLEFEAISQFVYPIDLLFESVRDQISIILDIQVTGL